MTSQEPGSDGLGIRTLVADPVKLLAKIKSKLTPGNQCIVDNAIERQAKLKKLVEYVQSRMAQQSGTIGAAGEAQILKLIVDYETQDISGQSTGFTQEHLTAIQEDFFQMKDFFSGHYRRRLVQLVALRGKNFLEPDERAEFEKIPQTDADLRRDFLVEKVSPRLDPFWYLVVSLCRLLQEGEFTFTASEALWFGLIDEALGTPCPSIRKFNQWKREKAQITAPDSTLKPLPT